MDEHSELFNELRLEHFDEQNIVRKSVQEGRRRRARRRLVSLGGVAAAFTAVVLLRGAALSDNQPSTIALAPAAQPGLGHHHSRNIVDLPSASATDQHLIDLLGDHVGTLVSQKELQGQWTSVVRTIDPDGSGAGDVRVVISHLELNDATVTGEAKKCALVGSSHAAETCTPYAGGWLYQYTGKPDVKDGDPGARFNEAGYIRRDGYVVSVEAVNYVDPAHPTRPAPVLAADVVSQFAQSESWFAN